MALVEVNALEKALTSLMERKGVKSYLEVAFDAQDIEWLINETPTVDAEPVRRGRWKEPYPNDIWDCYECSCCGAKYDRTWNYCPNCGAKMVEEEEDETEV